MLKITGFVGCFHRYIGTLVRTLVVFSANPRPLPRIFPNISSGFLAIPYSYIAFGYSFLGIIYLKLHGLLALFLGVTSVIFVAYRIVSQFVFVAYQFILQFVFLVLFSGPTYCGSLRISYRRTSYRSVRIHSIRNSYRSLGIYPIRTSYRSLRTSYRLLQTSYTEIPVGPTMYF